MGTNAIGLDMGGTSTDISLVYEGEPKVTKEWSVEYGYPIRFPSIEVLTIGAGGGSLAWIDEAGSLRNGPQSAGAEPGPASYGRGGEEPTNTDANLLLGRLGTELIGGGMELDRDAAEAAIRDKSPSRSGSTPMDAAGAVIEVANANMADAVRLISIRKGYDPREFALVVFGGAGPLHGAALAKELMIPTVIVPPNPGVTSALGCLLVDVRHDLSEMYSGKADEVDAAEVEEAFARLEQEAREMLDAEGIPEDRVRLDARDRHALRRPVAGAADRGRRAARVARPRRRGVPLRARARALLSPRGLAGRGLPAQRARGRRDGEGRAAAAMTASGGDARAAPARARSCFDAARTPSRRPSTTATTCPPARASRARPSIDQLDSTVARPTRGAGRGRRVAEHPHADRAGGRVMSTETDYKLDPVTLEVLKNAFVTIVDEMAEQILRTCHSFVIYCRDFSSALCDAQGNTVMQGSQDIAVHVGTLHLTAKAVIETFGDDIHEGDLFAINDPYSGGTHFNDVRIIRPIFHDGELIAFSQSNGHWADVGGSVPGSFDVSAKEHFAEGIRIPPVRIADGARCATTSSS